MVPNAECLPVPPPIATTELNEEFAPFDPPPSGDDSPFPPAPTTTAKDPETVAEPNIAPPAPPPPPKPPDPPPPATTK